MRIVQFNEEEFSNLILFLEKLPPNGFLKTNVDVVAYAEIIKKLSDSPEVEEQEQEEIKEKKDDKTN